MGDPRRRLRRVGVLILKARNASHGEVTVKPTLSRAWEEVRAALAELDEVDLPRRSWPMEEWGPDVCRRKAKSVFSQRRKDAKAWVKAKSGEREKFYGLFGGSF